MKLVSCKTADTAGVTAEIFELLGGQSGVGRVAGVAQQTAGYWLRRGFIPAEKVLAVEAELEAKGSQISRYDIRPDVYGPRPEAA